MMKKNLTMRRLKNDSDCGLITVPHLSSDNYVHRSDNRFRFDYVYRDEDPFRFD